MGAGASRLNNTQTATKIEELIKTLDTECDEVLHRDMKPFEVALLIMLHRKHSDTITFNASHIRWKWRKGSLISDFDDRVKKLKEEGKIGIKRPLDSENFINNVKKELTKFDLHNFPNESEDAENSSSDIESEERINNYLKEQNIRLSSMNRDRIKDIIDNAEFDNSSDTIDVTDNLLQKLDEINERYKEKMMKQLNNQRENLSEILNNYHEEQLKMIKKIDEERVKEVERRTCPSSSQLVKTLKTDDDPDLDSDSLKLIDDMTNNIMKKTTKAEELKKIFKDHRGRERQLKVSIELPHREKDVTTEDKCEYKHIVARHLRDHAGISIKSIHQRGIKTQEEFDREITGVYTAR